VGATGGLGVALLGGRTPGVDETLDVAVIGYERPPRGVPAPPRPGTGWADRRLADDGVRAGDVVAVGPAGVPVEVLGFVSDTSYLLQEASGRADGVPSGELASRIDAATGGRTSSLTKDEAILSLPGTREQNGVFTALIGVTLFVAGLVSALFFALVTLERTPLYATLKAIGAGSGRLLLGVVLQALAVASGAVLIGGAITLGLAEVIPAAIPVQLEPSRSVASAVLVVVTGALGGLVSLRRIVRVDPATAIA